MSFSIAPGKGTPYFWHTSLLFNLIVGILIFYGISLLGSDSPFSGPLLSLCLDHHCKKQSQFLDFDMTY